MRRETCMSSTEGTNAYARSIRPASLRHLPAMAPRRFRATAARRRTLLSTFLSPPGRVVPWLLTRWEISTSSTGTTIEFDALDWTASSRLSLAEGYCRRMTASQQVRPKYFSTALPLTARTECCSRPACASGAWSRMACSYASPEPGQQDCRLTASWPGMPPWFQSRFRWLPTAILSQARDLLGEDAASMQSPAL